MRVIIFSILSISAAVLCCAQQAYVVSVETMVNGKSADKFTFEAVEGQMQEKGFEAMMMAKRYRGKGWPHRVLQAEETEKKAAKKLSDQIKAEKAKTAMQKAEEKLSALKDRMYSVRDGITSGNASLSAVEAQVKILEEIVAKGKRGAAAFEGEFNEYLKRYDPPKKIDEEYEAMLRRVPKNTGDIEELEWGSFCNFTINSVKGDAAVVDIDFAYSALLKWLEADGNNNDNTITKYPIFERYEMLGLKNYKLPIGKPYCFQFKRQSIEDARTLQDALAESSIMGGKSYPDTSSEKSETAKAEPKQSYEDAGLLSGMKDQNSRGTGLVRVIITIRPSKR